MKKLQNIKKLQKTIKTIKTIFRKYRAKNITKILCLCIILLTIILSVRADNLEENLEDNSQKIEMTEIMFNPLGSDTGYEWIEISGCTNFSEYKLFENNINHNIKIFMEKNYTNTENCISIICDNCENFLTYASTINTINNNLISFDIYDSAFSLNNNGEPLALLKENIIIDEINYSLYLPIDEGLSLQKINDTWLGKNATPGEKNVLDIINYENNTCDNVSNNTDNNTNTDSNQTLPEIVEEIFENETIHEIINETIEIYANASDVINMTNTNNTLDMINMTDTNNTLNWSNLSDATNVSSNTTSNTSIRCIVETGINIIEEKIFKNNEQIKFRNEIYSIIDEFNNSLEEENFIYEYWIEDLSGNIIKKPVNTTNLNQKTYTAKITESDKVIKIRNRLYMDCLENASESEKIVIIFDDDFENEKDECECSQIQDTDNIDYGESYITVTKSNNKAIIEAYRGDTRKYSIDMQIDGYKGFEYNLKLDKGSRIIATYTVPEVSCGSKLVVEGMDIKEEMGLECEEKNKTSIVVPKELSKKRLEIDSLNISGNRLSTEMPILKTFNHTNDTRQAVYESTVKQNKTYFIAGLTIILTITAVIIISRNGLKEFLSKQ